MEEKVIEMILSRMDRIEQKLDQVLERYFIAIGMTICVGAIITAGFQIALAYFQKS